MFKSNMSDGFVSQVTTTRKGYTGHEMLDDNSLIHMNGRVYDPNIGRFLSADILVQAPTNSQSYNRYSYVWNNPLSMVDPSGYEVVTGQIYCIPVQEGVQWGEGEESVEKCTSVNEYDDGEGWDNQSMSCSQGVCNIIGNKTPDSCAPNCKREDYQQYQQALEKMHNELFEQAEPSSNMSGRSTEQTFDEKGYKSLVKRIAYEGTQKPTSNINLTKTEFGLILQKELIETLNVKISVLGYVKDHARADTIIYSLGLASTSFNIEGFGIVKGGDVNYVSVGMMAAHYGHNQLGIAMQSTAWNLIQYAGGEGSHNLSQMYSGAFWAGYGSAYYHENK